MPKKKKTERESLEFYLSLKYPITLYPDSDPEVGYVIEIKDLPGCMTQGETVDEAMSNIEEARELWIEAVYEQGNDIPLPSTENQYSGRVLLRMPRSLHQQLVENAEREEVSFNQYVVSLLSERNAYRDIDKINKQLDSIHSLLSEQKVSSLSKEQLENSAKTGVGLE
ncbi:type II toxin-antitoxin system HicB family antitoxin [Floridanema evergladense]|uniref:Type II toxin-antitoxin system HicB family antitoxin n=1 Tax=Floridaenema evergladense BLCC-F167 TaxID=3153639 RepID=A0ABV4WF68_9CYAN